MSKVLILFLTVFLSACDKGEGICTDTTDISNIKLRVNIQRLEQEMFALQDTVEIRAFLHKYPEITQKYLKKTSQSPDSLLANVIDKLIHDKYIDTIYKDCQRKFGDLEDIREEFETAFRHIKFYYPDFKIPKIYTLITGLGAFFGNDLYVSEDMIVISLEFFLGEGARYRPNVPAYIWKRYHKKAIVATCLQYISNQYNQTNLEDKTMLADMIYFGKATYFTKTMMPCLPDSILQGYSLEELRNIGDEANRKYVWAHFIDKKVLFSTSHFTKQTYLEERPYIAEINAKCPGRVGRWFGWRIIRKYTEKNPTLSFQDIMKNSNPQLIFQQSGYKGD